MVVTATRPNAAVGSLPDVQGAYLFSGKKTEVVRLDSLHANTAQNIERQILGRIPGANFSETEGSGFPSNGIGFRGLSATQSVEVNTRQDGVNIAADLYGYPETYYVPPTEAVDRIEIVRGASALQYGPQFGGAVNYVLRDAKLNTPLTVTAQQTGGSFGTFNSYGALGGGTERVTYYGFLQYRNDQGWRPNSDFNQTSAYAKLGYQASRDLHLSLDYSLLRNRIHMPGGFSDAQFAADPRGSFRSRNWLESPWNIVTAKADYAISPTARLATAVSYMFSARSLVWRNEDGGPQTLDVPNSTGQYVPREVQREHFNNLTTESRLLVEHHAFGLPNTLATGVRMFLGTMARQGGGPGSTGSDFDLRLHDGAYEYDLTFGTQNLAAFAENTLHLTDRLAVTPGARIEYVHSTAHGYTDLGRFPNSSKGRSYPLLGLGGQYILTPSTQLYANATQAYRPITYDALTPFASASVIDPKLHDAKGYNADLGWRGSLGRALSFDVGLFYLRYNDRIGLVALDSTAEVTNVGNSVHRGVESYMEVVPTTLFGVSPRWGSVRVFDSFAYVDARYVSGPPDIKGNEVENAPPIVNRAGITYGLGAFSTTLQVSHTAKSYADATNAVVDLAAPGPIGVIPGYHVLDFSASLLVARSIRVQGGINNLTNAHYFTLRTNEYPGPGIIPAIGRSIYLGAGITVAP
ncbi:MAG: TonB-dependent receptor family protein [Gemmatimonadaceae bacterium]